MGFRDEDVIEDDGRTHPGKNVGGPVPPRKRSRSGMYIAVAFVVVIAILIGTYGR